MFDGPEVEIKVKPHGNSKLNTPFFTIAKKTRERIQVLAASSTPKQVVQKVTNEQGGEINARELLFFLVIDSKRLTSEELSQSLRIVMCSTA